MKKMKLALESLAVESFETVPAGYGERGTVHAHSPSAVPDDSQESCDGLCGGGTAYYTCGVTCERCSGNTCDYWSCDFTSPDACW